MFKLLHPLSRPATGAGASTGPATTPQTAAPAAPVIIADRGEFIDALRRLRLGLVLVRPRAASDQQRTSCMLDGAYVYTAYEPLLRYGLIAEFDNPQGFASMRYFRITSTGKRFADKAFRVWRQQPLLQRLAVRFLG